MNLSEIQMGPPGIAVIAVLMAVILFLSTPAFLKRAADARAEDLKAGRSPCPCPTETDKPKAPIL